MSSLHWPARATLVVSSVVSSLATADAALVPSSVFPTVGSRVGRPKWASSQVGSSVDLHVSIYLCSDGGEGRDFIVCAGKQ